MQKFLRPRFLIILFLLHPTCFNKAVAQTVQIIANQGQTTNIVIGPNNCHVSENIYTETEIGVSNFTTPALLQRKVGT